MTRHRASAKGRPAKRERGAAALDLAELPDRTGYVIRRAQVWIFQDVIRAMAKHDIRPAEFSVMTVIDANDGTSQSAVSQALGIERARLAVMLHKLEARDLVKRADSSRDRRSNALHLTASGRKMLGALKRAVAQHEERVVARIGADGKRELLRILAPFLGA
jgi:DNA-binding MarR family transcriptional regulator